MSTTAGDEMESTSTYNDKEINYGTPSISLPDEISKNSIAQGQDGELAREETISNKVDASPGDGTITGNNRQSQLVASSEEKDDGDGQLPLPLRHNHDNRDQLLTTEMSTGATDKDSELNHRCFICGPPKDAHKTEYTKLSLFPGVEKEVRELLKILTAPDNSDVCCDRCLGFMKTFIRLKNDFLSMRRKIIALHIDAQLELSKNAIHKESEEEDHDLSDQENKAHDLDNQGQNSEVLVKQEVIDYGFEEDNNLDEKLECLKKCRCQHCSLSFTGMYDLKMHLMKEHENIHTEKKPFKCQYCDSSFRRKNNCVQHEKRHRMFKCKICYKNFATADEHNSHKGTHTRQKNYISILHSSKCQNCNEKFFNKMAFLKHKQKCVKHAVTSTKKTKSVIKNDKRKKTSDSGTKLFQCSYCDKLLSKRNALIMHEKIHNSKRVLKCEHCEKSFTRTVDLVEHEKIHELKCSYCNKSYWGTRALKRHEKIHSSEKSHLIYTCSYCDRTFTRRRALDLHEVIHKDDRLKCKSCEKTFTRKADLVEHERIHELKCSHCGKSCWGIRALNRHEKIHTGEKPHKCKHCGKSFAYGRELEAHMRTHTGEKPYLCQYCTQSFALNSTLKMHEMTKHTGEKPHKCQYCGKGFPAKLACEEHERFHTGEKPFKCDFCDRRFVRKANWRDHIKTHLGIKPQVCSFCGKGFRDRGTLAIHERTHTGERPFRCKYCDKTFIRKSKCNAHEKSHTGEKMSRKQPSDDKLKSQNRVSKNKHAEDNSSRSNHSNGLVMSQQLDSSFISQQFDSTYKPQHSESTFRPQHTDSTFRSQHMETSFRGPHSSNVFPTPEAVYHGDNPNPYGYNMYMPGM
ncbi:zinc finger protein 431-like [Lingula anatina]|uniref:Zinc finger protein 431-like n=1 Tax=Lingula anatina TaxID=7574 RepID=A0A1S3KBD4_LINAN|nr:zinc finger protein 431-like [Lingula anatina]|eukprot:XP_013419802.1 zinc finger protein 431-like [Lingula anatina]